MSGWRPERLPAVRDRMVRRLVVEAERAAGVARLSEVTPGLAPDLLAGAEAAPRLWRRLAGILEEARLWWLAPAACRMAVEAGAERAELDDTWAPDDTGLLAAARPLGRFDPAMVGGLVLRAPDRMVEYTRPVPVDAIAWSRGEAGVEVHLLCKTRRLPHPLLGVAMPLTPLQDATLALPLARGLSPVVGAGGVDTDGSVHDLAMTMQSAWGLAALAGDRPAGDVRIVDGWYGLER